MSDEKTKTVLLPEFGGEKKNYKVWLKRFVAYCTVKGFLVALKDTCNLPADPNTLSTSADAKEKEERQLRRTVLQLHVSRCFSPRLKTWSILRTSPPLNILQALLVK